MLIAQPQVQRQVRSDPPVVLDKESSVAGLSRISRVSVDASARGQTQQKLGEGLPEGRAARVFLGTIDPTAAEAVRPDRVPVIDGTRSEERRVGKECRSRWSPDH